MYICLSITTIKVVQNGSLSTIVVPSSMVDLTSPLGHQSSMMLLMVALLMMLLIKRLLSLGYRHWLIDLV